MNESSVPRLFLFTTIHHPPTVKTADRQKPSGKTFSQKNRFSRRKRAFALAAFEKTLENSLVMFWKKSPMREKPRNNGLFSMPPFSDSSEKRKKVELVFNLSLLLVPTHRVGTQFGTLRVPCVSEISIPQIPHNHQSTANLESREQKK
jgi:hypothetical protein